MTLFEDCPVAVGEVGAADSAEIHAGRGWASHPERN